MNSTYEHLVPPHEDPTDWEKHKRRSRAQTWLLSLLVALIAAVGSSTFILGLQILERVSAVESIAAPVERVAALEASLEGIESRQSRMERRQLGLESRHTRALENINIELREINGKLGYKVDKP